MSESKKRENKLERDPEIPNTTLGRTMLTGGHHSASSDPPLVFWHQPEEASQGRLTSYEVRPLTQHPTMDVDDFNPSSPSGEESDGTAEALCASVMFVPVQVLGRKQTLAADSQSKESDLSLACQTP